MTVGWGKMEPLPHVLQTFLAPASAEGVGERDLTTPSARAWSPSQCMEPHHCVFSRMPGRRRGAVRGLSTDSDGAESSAVGTEGIHGRRCSRLPRLAAGPGKSVAAISEARLFRPAVVWMRSWTMTEARVHVPRFKHPCLAFASTYLRPGAHDHGSQAGATSCFYSICTEQTRGATTASSPTTTASPPALDAQLPRAYTASSRTAP